MSKEDMDQAFGSGDADWTSILDEIRTGSSSKVEEEFDMDAFFPLDGTEPSSATSSSGTDSTTASYNSASAQSNPIQDESVVRMSELSEQMRQMNARVAAATERVSANERRLNSPEVPNVAPQKKLTGSSHIVPILLGIFIIIPVCSSIIGVMALVLTQNNTYIATIGSFIGTCVGIALTFLYDKKSRDKKKQTSDQTYQASLQAREAVIQSINNDIAASKAELERVKAEQTQLKQELNSLM